MKVNGKHKSTINRRDFLKTTALLGGSAALSQVGCALSRLQEAPELRYTLNDAESQIFTVCLQCHTDCPIKVKIFDGVAVKIDGNPYSLQTMIPSVKYATAVRDAAKLDGCICPKGQAGIQTLYDPYRITRVLKRAGKRGENKWTAIPFEQAIQEIVEGGRLFQHVPGEENRRVPGLKQLYRLRDAKLAKKMAKDAREVAEGKMRVAKFKQKYRRHLDLLIDPDHPDFGPVNNQFVFLGGRIEHGRKEFAQRWTYGGFGSANWFEHTTICEQSHHIAYEKMTDQYHEGEWHGGKHHLKPDLHSSEFVIFFGTGALEANFGPPYLSGMVADGLISGRLKFVVVDPRLSKTAAKAWKWLPVRPGGDAALAYAMIRWILDNQRYDARFLTNANRAAAQKDDETTWTNATYLVRIEKDGPGKLLRAADIGIGGEHQFVVMRNGRPVAVDPEDSRHEVEGELFYAGELRGIPVKSVLQLVAEYARSKSVKQWAEEAGLDADDVIEVAREFTRHGKKAVAELYRGAVQHTNGYYNAQAIISLNLLVGNVGWKGGLTSGGGHWHEAGDKPGQPFPLKKGLHPGKLTAFGHKLTREKSRYEESTLFAERGYPAERPWFPHTGNVYQEVLPSAAQGYPYPIKALFLHKGTPAISVPGGHRNIEILTDLEKIPLFFACDIVVGDTSIYADYIFPDITAWERWGTPHTTPACPTKSSKVRQPAAAPLVETVRVFGEEMPCSLEAVMLAIAEKLQMPGYGINGFGPGLDFRRPEDFYLKMVANIAAGDRPGDAVPAADEEEFAIFRKARRHLPPSVFDEEKWRQAVRDGRGRNWWPQVVHVLCRGGRYEDFDRYLRSGEKMPHPYSGLFSFYVESVAMTHHPYTGKRFSGLALVEPVRFYDGREVGDGDFPLRLITFKEILGGHSRTLPTDYWLSTILSQNFILVNEETGRRLGLRDGDRARLVSATNPDGEWDLKNGVKKPVEGRVRLLQGMRPGVVAVSWHFGHWGYGASDLFIDGEKIAADPVRTRGLCANAVCRLDDANRNTTLEDLIGGSASYYDTRVRLVKV